MNQLTNPVMIVMVEDDAGHARLIEKHIRRAGVGNLIVPFVNGADALAFLLGPDGSGAVNVSKRLLVLLDLNLPDMAGLDVLRRVKANEHLRPAPLVVLTTADDSREIRLCYDLGANACITKPVTAEGFSTAISHLGMLFAMMQIPQAG